MIIHFYTKYSSSFGEEVYFKFHNKLKSKEAIISLTYLNPDFWTLVILEEDIPFFPYMGYECFVKDAHGNHRQIFSFREIALRKLTSAKLDIFDEAYNFINEPVFETRLSHLLKNKFKKVADKDFNVVFKAFMPPLPNNKFLCITGSGKKLKEWDKNSPLLMYRKDDFYTIKLNFAKENTVSYKFAIFDLEKNEIVEYEEGENRVFFNSGKKVQSFISINPKFNSPRWKAAGLCIPVSSLKTQNDWGIGTFTALKEVVDWCDNTGLKLIQLLPVNDTVSSFTNSDSYPYSCISTFALNPAYIDVPAVADEYDFVIPAEIKELTKNLHNDSVVDFTRAYNLKISILRKIFEKGFKYFKDNLEWFDFFDINRDWLTPYAVFCYLRDKNKTADFAHWNEYKIYDEEAVLNLADPENEAYKEIAFYYFVQFYLHLQFKDAVEYVHKKGIILKGDLPIGIDKKSVETWMNPHLFIMELSAGAPPDMFTDKGQDWGFPLYNWNEMKKDNYSWWRKRIEALSIYFDAIRIDHVIGFLRMWSIPNETHDGRLGTFIPANGLSPEDFENAGIHFDEGRFCYPINNEDKSDVILIKRNEKYHFRFNMMNTNSFNNLPEDEQNTLKVLYHKYFDIMQNDLWYSNGMEKLLMIESISNMALFAENLGMVPPVTDSILQKLNILGLVIQRMPEDIGKRFADLSKASYLSATMPGTHDMSTVREWWETERDNVQYYFNNILGHAGVAPYFCEPEIAREIVEINLRSASMWSIFLLQDILAVHEGLRRDDPYSERINNPADNSHNWNFRMHLTFEKLNEQHQFNKHLRKMINDSGR